MVSNNGVENGQGRRVAMTHVMTDQELQQAIQDANEAVYSLSRPPQLKGPFPKREVRRRELILLRQLTAYKIQEAREQGERDLETLNTAIYRAMTSFLESYWKPDGKAN